jgi:hypothetical protein
MSDANTDADFDIDFRDGEGPVFSTASHVAVVILHAGTVDEGLADVTLDVRVTTQRLDGFPYEVAFEVPSGEFYIGDAEDSDEIALHPGRWLLQFNLDSVEDARHVELVMSAL